LQLADGDNVCIAAVSLHAGDAVSGPDGAVTIQRDVELGHKVASRRIRTGEKVVRFGMPIGSATADIAAGDWVHTHNLKSDYLRTFDHRGDYDEA
jgi:predicted RecA/RadA family phage recombinase